MHINNRLKLLILTILLGIFILFTVSNSKNINYNVECIRLSIYGQSETPYKYYTRNEKSIDYIVSKINSLSLCGNEIAHRDEFDIPKTTTYVLEISGNRSQEYIFIENYLLYNDFVYKINNSKSFINSIENKLKKEAS